MPADVQGRTRVMQWCFAATSTIGGTFTCLDFIGMFDPDRAAGRLHVETRQVAERWLRGLEEHLAAREWIAGETFTVADIMMAGELRTVRKSDLLDAFPGVKAYAARCHARPAWHRTLALYADRLGVVVADIA